MFLSKETENILDKPLNFDDFNSIRYFIHNTESNLLGGKNVDGEEVVVSVQKGVGMTVRTFQSNKWIRVDEYDENGIRESESYDGRWE